MKSTQFVCSSSAAAALAFALLVPVTATAAGVLLDRGLPTINLNDSAGASRSNVRWATNDLDPNDRTLVGDTFTNTSASAWQISTIRAWAIGPIDTAMLYGGFLSAGIGGIGQVSTGATIAAPSLYANSETYTDVFGPPSEIHQVDFVVNIVLAAGETFDFYFEGLDGGGYIPFYHASNAALSGSPQEGSDDRMREMRLVNGAAVSAVYWQASPLYWDKQSDMNVVVIGDVLGTVPEPGSLALVAAALLAAGAAGARSRRQRG